MLCWALWVVRSKLVLESAEKEPRPLTTEDTKVHKGGRKHYSATGED